MFHVNIYEVGTYGTLSSFSNISCYSIFHQMHASPNTDVHTHTKLVSIKISVHLTFHVQVKHFYLHVWHHRSQNILEAMMAFTSQATGPTAIICLEFEYSFKISYKVHESGKKKVLHFMYQNASYPSAHKCDNFPSRNQRT